MGEKVRLGPFHVNLSFWVGISTRDLISLILGVNAIPLNEISLLNKNGHVVF